MKICLVFLVYLVNFVAAKDKPHIILIIADDMGHFDVGYHGSLDTQTYNIDALAYSGIILNRHYVMPVCSPSRSALLTGKYPSRIGMQDLAGKPILPGERAALPLEEKLLPSYLKELGYSTHFLGKWHQGLTTVEYTPCRRGYENFLGYYSGWVGYYDIGCTYYQQNLNKTFSGFDLHDCNETRWDLQGEYLTDTLTRHAVDIINSHNNDTPLFLHISHDAVHTGNTTVWYQGLEPPPGVNVNTSYPWVKEYARRLYASMIGSMDKSIGEVVEALEQKNMLNNSIILFMSDNGGTAIGVGGYVTNYGSNYPLRGVKTTAFEGGVRGAAVIWSPLLLPRRGHVSNEFVHISDWFPTLYAAAGGDISQIKLDGVNQWQMLQTGAAARKDLLIDMADANEAAIIKGRYKIFSGGVPDWGALEKHSGCVTYDKNVTPPPYNYKAVRNSKVGRSVSRLYQYKYAFSKMRIQRRKATIGCKSECPVSFGSVEASNEFMCNDYCLFDIIKDECEHNDISSSNPDILQESIAYLEWARNFSVPSLLTHEGDPLSDPDLQGGVWVPWLAEGDAK